MEGMEKAMENEKHDLAIIGAGPAGLSAAVYAARYNIDFAIISRLPGGVMTEAYELENYPGVPKTSGEELTGQMVKQVEGFGHKIIQADVNSIVKNESGFEIGLNGKKMEAKKILLAIGAKRNKLNVPGEEELCGKGVSYCATCDGFFFKDKVVAVIGGGDAAAGAAVYLAGIAEKVYIILRRDEFRAAPSWVEQIKASEKIEIIYNNQVTEVVGEEKVKQIKLSDKPSELMVDGVFIEIGETPQSVLFDQLGIKRNHQGFVEVHQNGRTNVDGIWAAGDITTNSNGLRQIVTACAEGAITTVDIFTELRKERK
jgi:thioredoxin reductase (NADPH)